MAWDIGVLVLLICVCAIEMNKVPLISGVLPSHLFLQSPMQLYRHDYQVKSSWCSSTDYIHQQ